MSLELTARTEPGRRLVALAETLAHEIEPRAAVHDREASFPFESFADVKQSGYFTAPIPEEFGGLGVTSVHDVLVASSRLARGDAALTLGVNMHFAFLLNVVRRWQRRDRGRRRATRRERSRRTLEQIARDGTVFASAGSEFRQDLTRPATTATRTEDGWVISGTRCSAPCHPPPTSSTRPSPTPTTADSSGTATRWSRARRRASSSTTTGTRSACAPRAATRSPSRTCGFRSSALRGGFPVGDAVEYMERNLGAGLLHAAAALGIAESAHASVAGQLARRSDSDPHAQKCSRPRASSTSPPAAPSSRAPPR